MNEHEPPQSLEELGKRLKAARADASPRDGGEQGLSRARGLSAGFQVATELVVAMVVAVAIGWFLDEWLETRPLFLLVFFFLGAAAGALNVYRRAQQMIGDIETGDGKDLEGSADSPDKQD